MFSNDAMEDARHAPRVLGAAGEQEMLIAILVRNKCFEFEQCRESPVEGVGVFTAGKFPYGMHGKGRHADIRSAHADCSGGQGTDGATTTHIRSGYKGLDGYVGLLSGESE